jgi:hypothetical protein
LSGIGLLGLPTVARGGVLVVAGGGFGAAVKDADVPVRGGAVIVCDWGPRFPAEHVTVCRQGRPATEKDHDELNIRPACWAW